MPSLVLVEVLVELVLVEVLVPVSVSPTPVSGGAQARLMNTSPTTPSRVLMDLAQESQTRPVHWPTRGTSSCPTTPVRRP